MVKRVEIGVSVSFTALESIRILLAEAFANLKEGERVELVFTDPDPYMFNWLTQLASIGAEVKDFIPLKTQIEELIALLKDKKGGI